jgi:hypothetical protein
LPDDVPHPLPQFSLQNLVAILGDPDDVIEIVSPKLVEGEQL